MLLNLRPNLQQQEDNKNTHGGQSLNVERLARIKWAGHRGSALGVWPESIRSKSWGGVNPAR